MSSTTPASPPPDARRPPSSPTPCVAPAPTPPRGPRRRSGAARRPTRPGRGPRCFALLAVDGGALPLGPRRVGLGELVLLGARCRPATKSWKAFFFGSTDASNFITIDKTPVSLWPMAISARIFGVNSWTILVPQALEGVRDGRRALRDREALVRRRARRCSPARVAALTPVAALMFRFNNPDALLVLLLVGARLRDDPRARRRARPAGSSLAGALVGFAFLTKELQAFLVLPGFGLVYLIAGPPRARATRRGSSSCSASRRSSPAVGGSRSCSSRPRRRGPYIGGSQNNSFWNVLFGYNGFGRLTGNETGSVGGGAAVGGQGGQWGPTGWTRLFNAGVRRSGVVAAPGAR